MEDMFVRRVVLGLGAVLLAICAGCSPGSGRGTEAHVSGIPVLAGSVSQPGSPLPLGLNVPAGSVLVGEPIPTGPSLVYKGKRVPDHGWEAFLLVTGRPSDTVRSFVAQLKRLGYSVYSGPGCRQHGSSASCLVGGTRGPEQDRRELTLAIDRGPATGRTRYPASFAVIHSRDEDFYPGSPQPMPAEPGTLDPDAADVPMPTGWSSLARPGDVLGKGVPDTPTLHLPPGISQAMPLMPFECLSGQYQAVLRVDGDPPEAFEALHRQILGHPNDGPRTTTTLTEMGRRTYRFSVSSGGSWSFEARMVMATGTRGWLVIETCYD